MSVKICPKPKCRHLLPDHTLVEDDRVSCDLCACEFDPRDHNVQPGDLITDEEYFAGNDVDEEDDEDLEEVEDFGEEDDDDYGDDDEDDEEETD